MEVDYKKIWEQLREFLKERQKNFEAQEEDNGLFGTVVMSTVNTVSSIMLNKMDELEFGKLGHCALCGKELQEGEDVVCAECSKGATELCDAFGINID